ncbi:MULTISPECIES: hypothetical protein [unclassified Streptomyces]|uniref:hypothetical protein n=1 Tax=unclassified Streptomyces TaxID=2593676 RepID=UPI0022575273|nr:MULTISPECIES: hypothetical protein [unclassified Streptomyces]MCX4629730.1 hypothetical protein [Streptomyces sp. NBC_01443]WSW45705.1 hypothetical protein OG296_22790 [Streptomyces sp. NBC_01001]
MHRGLVHALAWTLATGAAVTLSWWGVHTVMSGTAYDPPLAVPLTTQPLSSSTHSAAAPSPEPAPDSPSPSPSASPSAAASSAKPPQKAAPPSPRPEEQQGDGGDPGKVKAYPVTGGRVVFDLGTTSAELVSATPDAGWQMQVWKQPYWIRVTFTKAGREMSVFCTWNGHPPLVETYEG